MQFAIESSNPDLEHEDSGPTKNLSVQTVIRSKLAVVLFDDCVAFTYELFEFLAV